MELGRSGGVRGALSHLYTADGGLHSVRLWGGVHTLVAVHVDCGYQLHQVTWERSK